MPRHRIILLALIIVIALLGIYGAVSIEQFGLHAFVSLLSVYGVAAIIFAESGLLIGFFLPGDSVLFTTGFLIYQDVIQFDIHLAALVLFMAAALGDSVGYAFGRHVGRRLFQRKHSSLFHADNLRRAEAFYARHGGKTLILARFMPVIRTFAPIVAGASHMNYRRFLFFNLVGALIWAVGYVYLGYFVGNWAETTGFNIQYVILAIILLSVIPPIVITLKNPSRRTTILRTIQQQVRAFFAPVRHK